MLIDRLLFSSFFFTRFKRAMILFLSVNYRCHVHVPLSRWQLVTSRWVHNLISESFWHTRVIESRSWFGLTDISCEKKKETQTSCEQPRLDGKNKTESFAARIPFDLKLPGELQVSCSWIIDDDSAMKGLFRQLPGLKYQCMRRIKRDLMV